MHDNNHELRHYRFERTDRSGRYYRLDKDDFDIDVTAALGLYAAGGVVAFLLIHFFWGGV